MNASRLPVMSVSRPDRGISVLVIASVRLYRDGICGSLAARAGFDVLGSAAAAADARPLIASRKPDVIVIDAAAHRSFEIVQRLRIEVPSAKIVAFGIEDCESDILACAEAGVNGYLLRDGSMDDLASAIGGAMRGEV